jgi:adenine-specific DNA-methyltransferase
MRYIGNKEKLLNEIDIFIKTINLKDNGLVFCDIFSGTGSVGFNYKKKHKIIANDNLYSSYILTHAKLNTPDLKFKTLKFDPFLYLGDVSKAYKGFIYKNYAPKESQRMYFSNENASRIDFIRSEINQWFEEKKIDYNEYCYLIACLLEAVSKVANVAGVYGSYLKHWDPRALKPILFKPLDVEEESLEKNAVFNGDVFDIIEKISGDIIYIDPPYTKNQYSVQYHILETIALYDNPQITGITGKRDTSKNTSVFSQAIKCDIAFERLIAKSNFKHIFVSYSSAGLMSEEFIENVLKRHGKEATYKVKKIDYKKYLNSKTTSGGRHVEYLFYIEKKEPKSVKVSSPLNYIGGKYDMLDFFRENLPKTLDVFVDLFGGGFNVGINVPANKVIYNDINIKAREIVEFFLKEGTSNILNYIKKNINKFNLTKKGKKSYLELRQIYNSIPIEQRDPKMLYLLLLYGFQQQLRFNTKLDYNNPVGQAGFNDKIYEKIISFAREIKSKNPTFLSEDFENLLRHANKETFFYCDPPYLITLGSYNDGKRGFNGWNEKDEYRLLSFLEKIDKLGSKFMLSNVLNHNNKENKILKDWVTRNKFKIVYYTDSSRTNTKREEIVVLNYK